MTTTSAPDAPEVTATRRSRLPAIAYAQCWEDPESGRQALQITAEDDLLTITSGGCNTLALALEEPRSITAVDSNAAQSHLLELKIAAIQALEYTSLLRFLGVRPSSHRRQTYAVVRGYLSPEAQAFWDWRQDLVEPGVVHAGRFEAYLSRFRRWVLPLIHSKKTLRQLLALDGLESQAHFYDTEWDTRRWRLLFRIFFSRRMQDRFGRYPGAFRYVDIEDVGEHFLGRVHHALTDLPIAGNYFLEYIATGGYADLRRLPPYLLEQNVERLRNASRRIRVVTASLDSFLERADEGSFSKFYLSDLFERVSPDQYEASLRRLMRAARNGSRLCYYNNLVRRRHPESMEPSILEEVDLGRRLHGEDRSFFYSRFVVERISK